MRELIERARRVSPLDAEAWKRRTGRAVVACPSPIAPEEIVHAAGLLPVRAEGGFDATFDGEPSGLDRARRTMAALGGRRVADTDLRWSIGVYNRNRFLLRELLAARREGRVTSDDVRALMNAGRFLPCEAHSDLVESALDAARNLPRRPVDPSFDETAESVRWCATDVDATGDPLTSLSRALGLRVSAVEARP